MLHLETWQCTHRLQRFLLLKNAGIGWPYHLIFASHPVSNEVIGMQAQDMLLMRQDC
jgi:hypothetical protein